MISQAFRTAFALWRDNWGVLLGITVIGYWPIDLLQAYVESRWLDPENFSASLKLTRFADQFFLIIPDAAFYYIALSNLSGRKVSLGDALGEGFSNYGRMWITRFLAYMSYATLLLLIVPGVYMLTRWQFAEAVTIAEDKCGSKAFGRSWVMTKGKVWPLLLAICVGFTAFICMSMLPTVVWMFLPDNWVVDGLASMTISLSAPFIFLYQAGLYVQLASE